MSQIDADVLSELIFSHSENAQSNDNCRWNQMEVGARPRGRKCHRTHLLLLLSCCLTLTLGKSTWASTINYVQGNYATPQTAKSTVSVKYKSVQTAGDLNVVVVGWNNSTAKVNAISDSIGNTYLLAVGPTIVSGTLSQSIYFAKNIAAASAGANSVVVTFSKTASYPDIRILEYSGADPNNPVDAFGANSGTSSPTNASTTTVNPADLLFAANTVRTVTTGPGVGFTQRLLTSADADIAEDEMVAAAGNYAATAPLNEAGSWIMQVVAFRPPFGAASSSVAPSALSCSSSSMTGAGTDTCTVTLNTASGSGGFVVNLTSNNSAVTVPSSVEVAAGATGASFPATASAVGTAQAATLTASAGSVSQTFTLHLNVAAAALSINATSIAFGGVNLNTPATQSVTLTSTGSAPVTVNSASVSGTGFSMSRASFPVTLNPNQTAAVSVEFDPTAAGSATGALTVTSNSSSNPTATVGLSGTGVATAYSVQVTWSAPGTSPDPVASYNVYRSPSGSSTYQLMGSVNSGQLSYADSNNIQNGQTYDYIVESVDSSGNESVASNMASVSIP